MSIIPKLALTALLAVACTTTPHAQTGADTPAAQAAIVLQPADYLHYVQNFNAMEDEPVVNFVPNAQSWDWMMQNIPLLDVPATRFEEIYYYRWWTFRKHLKQTPDGYVFNEFIVPRGYAGAHNTIACAVGHHIAEGRWLRNKDFIDQYTHFWYRSGENGGEAPNFKNFSSWVPAALWNRSLVTGDQDFLVDLLDDFIEEYQRWEADRQRPDGLFWQYDVRDGMEESISGGRRPIENVRPTINSYMIANARAIAAVARLAGRQDVVAEYTEKADALQAKMIDTLWNPDLQFFTVLYGGEIDKTGLSDAREAIGFIPWMFNIPGPEHSVAWAQIKDPEGFWAPWGLTTAERRHPGYFGSGKTRSCEWDGAIWPFASSQTLNGLANVLRTHNPEVVGKGDYFDQIVTYARAQSRDGIPQIREYQHPVTGEWLKGRDSERSRYYNHSTFNDLVINGLVGLVPRADDTVEVDPLIPNDPDHSWNWFCLDGVPYHGRNLTVIWDRTGERYGKGQGLSVWVDGTEVARSASLERITGEMP